MPWRNARAPDLSAISRVADEIHTQHPEDPEVFTERLRLYPQGCFVCEEAGDLVGYAISHPWVQGSVPALNSRLGRIPEASDTYYVHDIALLSSARGRGLGAEIVRNLKRQAAALGLRTISLVAVNRSAAFWQALGFRVKDVPGLREKLLSYGADAVYMQQAT